ncbi:MAG: TIGR03620 family F420-dependent LLM class oxidoreductase [Acidimicrobiales bacterium]
MELGEVGVWWSGTWRKAEGSELETAAELEELGYGALWSSGGFDPGLSSRFERLLAATGRLTVASGIVSIWAGDAGDVSQAVGELETLYPGRFLLGVGASHAVAAGDYHLPYSHMVGYLDALDSAGVVAADRRVLAALGPRMLRLAADRALGAHPYFVPVEHTARARETLGAGALLAPEVTVVLERDPATARHLARTFTTGYLTLPNYSDNLRTLGYSDDDVAGGGSDRLVDAVVCWGDVDTVAAQVRRHLEAGADHVCLQVVSDGRDTFPMAEYRLLAPAVLGR